MTEKEPISDRTELQTQLLVAAYSRLIYVLFQEKSLLYKMTNGEKSKWVSLSCQAVNKSAKIIKYQVEKSRLDEQLSNSPYREVLVNVLKHPFNNSLIYHECFTLEKDGGFFISHHSLKDLDQEIIGGYFFSFRIPKDFFAPEFSCEYSGISFISLEPGKSSDFFYSLNVSDKKSLLSAIGAKILRAPSWIVTRVEKTEPFFKSFETRTREPEILEASENWAICLANADYEINQEKIIYRFRPPLIIFHKGEQFRFQSIFKIDYVPSLP